MTDPWVCLECGARQPEPGACRACRRDDTSDLRDAKIRELAVDIEQRLAHDREKRQRFIGVGVGMVVVFAIWLVPGFWEIRQRTFALPLLFDQWMAMALIGLGVMWVLARRDRRRFPYLRDDLTLS